MSRLQAAVFQVLEGFTLSDDVRKILEAAYYEDDTFAQGRAAGLEEAADPMPDCPRCNGSGEEEVMDGDGPDAHPIMVNCTHCGGVGSLSAAYKHLLAELATANSKYLDACGKLYFANLSPTSSDAGKDDARDAARLDYIYHLTAVKPFIAPIVSKEKWIASIDTALSSLEVIGKGEKG